MATYGATSAQRLSTCHKDIQTLFNSVIEDYDCQIIRGHSTDADQLEAYKKGREFVNGKWVIKNKFEIVTYCDGINNKSNHNESPSLAVDVMPYPVDWKDKYSVAYFAGKVMERYRALKAEGEITSEIRWGGDWNGNNKTLDERLIDFPHYEIV